MKGKGPMNWKEFRQNEPGYQGLSTKDKARLKAAFELNDPNSAKDVKKALEKARKAQARAAEQAEQDAAEAEERAARKRADIEEQHEVDRMGRKIARVPAVSVKASSEPPPLPPLPVVFVAPVD